MKFIQFFINRPIFATVVSTLILIVGLLCFTKLPVSGYPNLQNPVIGVHTESIGASSQFMENEISRIIENGVSGISGIQNIESNSQAGISDVIITFQLGVNINEKLNQVSNAIAKIRGQLPNNISGPDIHQDNPNDKPIINLFFSSTDLTLANLTDYINRYVTPTLEEIKGVGQIALQGQRNYAVRVWLEPNKMAGLHVTVNDVINALKTQNVQTPGGRFNISTQHYPIVINALVHSINDFKQIIVLQTNSKTIRLKNIAQVKLGVETTNSLVRFNGKAGVAVGIIATSSANLLNVAQSVQQTLAKIKTNLPANIKVQTGYDFTNYLRGTVHSVYETLFYAILLVIIILLLIGSFRAALIPVITMPFSLIGSFIFIYLAGYSINIITLLAIILAIGLVVDDAIVVMENIQRHIEKSAAVDDATLRGTQQIMFVVLGMTIILIATFAPIAFIKGFIGKLFWQFAFTLIVAVLISGFVAITLSPVMCRYLLTAEKSQGFYTLFIQKLIRKLAKLYSVVLTKILKSKRYMIMFLILLFLVGAYAFTLLPKKLAPLGDQGFIVMQFSAPSNAAFNFTKHYALQLEKILAKAPDSKSYMIATGFPTENQGQAILLLKPFNQRHLSAEQISQYLNQHLKKLTGLNISVSPPPPFGIDGQGGFPIEIILMGNSDYRALNKIANAIKMAMAQRPEFSNIDSNLKWNSLEYAINVNRELAGTLGVSVSAITNTLTTMLGGYAPSKFLFQGKTYDILLQSEQQFSQSPQSLENFYVKTASSHMIPVNTLVTLSTSTEPTVLSHFDRLRSEHIMADLAPGYSMGQGVQALQQVLKQTLPSGVHYQYFGQTYNFLQSQNSIVIAFALSLIFIYLLLAALFESLRDPFIIIIAVPLSIIGALIVLQLSHNSLNIFSEIGLIALAGLISKHGMLLTEFANGLRKQGLTKEQAIIKAAQLRLRPILITTGAMVFGAIPLILASGPSSASQRQIGIVICGGLLIGTLFTLFILPVIYCLIAPPKLKKMNSSID